MQELLQQALIRLTVKKGSFLYDPALSSRLFLLRQTTKNKQAQALLLAKEALSGMEGVTVRSAEVAQTACGLRLYVLLQVQQTQAELEVSL